MKWPAVTGTRYRQPSPDGPRTCYRGRLPYRKQGDTYAFAIFNRSDCDEDFWQALSGGAEDDETPIEAATRAMWEESRIGPGARRTQLDSIETKYLHRTVRIQAGETTSMSSVSTRSVLMSTIRKSRSQRNTRSIAGSYLTKHPRCSSFETTASLWAN
jgi:hypothetical protein